MISDVTPYTTTVNYTVFLHVFSFIVINVVSYGSRVSVIRVDMTLNGKKLLHISIWT